MHSHSLSCRIKKQRSQWITAIFLLVSLPTTTQANTFRQNTPCTNMCSGNGKCTLPYGVCDCFHGFMGADCSLRTCPRGHAWTDDIRTTTLIGNDDGHHFAECSNRGSCDRVLGECICDPSFEGAACERKSCPNRCSNRGRCVSLRTLAQMQDPGERIKEEGCTSTDICRNEDCSIMDYSACQTTIQYDSPWDAEMMYGCMCDEGYEGYDCSQRSCATGDDPLTSSQVNDIQLIECIATGGSFTLSFQGKTTVPIHSNATLSELTHALTSLETIRRSGIAPSVLVRYTDSSIMACNETGNDIQVTFLQNFGDLPLLIPDGTNLYHSDHEQVPIITSQKLIRGNKEDAECSNRGFCWKTTGACECLQDWTTSDGYGGPGTRGDCGYQYVNSTTSCPGEPACLMHGTCSGYPEYRCLCQEGFMGPDCSLMTCPEGNSWFRPPTSENTAHTLSECSDMGICDREEGKCLCAEGFFGSACEYLSCPGQPINTCSGHGTCVSMYFLSTQNMQNGEPHPFIYGTDPNNPTTWDRDQMMGCFCSEGWEGFDCSLRSCPKGDDPQTLHQDNEVQEFTCMDSDSVGTFRLKFRGQETDLLHANDTIVALEVALNSLQTVNSVIVSTDTSSQDMLCPAMNQTIRVEFLSPTGDLPLITISFRNDIDGPFLITEVIHGTKEYALCSNRGLCDHSRGQCKCFSGYGSSDGQGNPGLFADCGYKSPYSTPSLLSP